MKMFVLALLVICFAQSATAQSSIQTAEKLADVTALLLPLAEMRLATCRQPASLTAKARTAIADNWSYVAAARTLAQRFRNGDERALGQLTDAVNAMNRTNRRLAGHMALCD